MTTSVIASPELDEAVVFGLSPRCYTVDPDTDDPCGYPAAWRVTSRCETCHSTGQGNLCHRCRHLLATGQLNCQLCAAPIRCLQERPL